MSGNAAEFDPYHKWLGIPPREQPPNHYRLLGLQQFETDEEVIEAAASRLIAFCEQNAAGPHAAEARRMVFEIAAARLCLLDPAQRADYDRHLRPAAVRRAPTSAARHPATRTVVGTERTATSPLPPLPALPAVPPVQVRPAAPTTPVAKKVPQQVPLQRSLPSVVAPVTNKPVAPQAADVSELNALFGQAPVVAKPPGFEPSPEANSEFSGLFDAIASNATTSAAKRSRGSGRVRTVALAEKGERGAERKSGKKKKHSQSLIVTGGLAALALLVMIVGAVLLLGGGDAPATSGKPAKSNLGDDETAADSADENDSTDSKPEQLTAVAKPDVAPPIKATPKIADEPLQPAPGEPPVKDAAVAADEQEEGKPEMSKQAATDKLLQLCSRGGSDLELRKLISSGADMEAADVNRRTPLRLAVSGKHFLLAKALLAAKADVNATDARGETALMSAAQQGDEKLIMLLLDAKADPQIATIAKGDRPAGTTPLHVAARHGNAAAIQILIEHGARLEQSNQQGVTPLMVAAWQGHEAAALALLEKGADVKTTFDGSGQTPLMYAAHGGNLAIVEAMIAKGASVTHKTSTGVTALSIALGSPEANEAIVTRLRNATAQEAPALDF